MFSRAFVKIREYSIKIGKHCDANRVKECKFDDFSLKYLHCAKWWTYTYVLKFWSGDVQKDVNLIHLVESKRMAISYKRMISPKGCQSDTSRRVFGLENRRRRTRGRAPQSLDQRSLTFIDCIDLFRSLRSNSITSIYFDQSAFIRNVNFAHMPNLVYWCLVTLVCFHRSCQNTCRTSCSHCCQQLQP